ncbi:protein of unknown function [Brochothrix thermosphacta]|nr:hypothetical protein FM106_21240 [Brachybacterium faecium]SPN73037.1 protein of unknown function [Brochothrix thermosphacta]
MLKNKFLFYEKAMHHCLIPLFLRKCLSKKVVDDGSSNVIN